MAAENTGGDRPLYAAFDFFLLLATLVRDRPLTIPAELSHRFAAEPAHSRGQLWPSTRTRSLFNSVGITDLPKPSAHTPVARGSLLALKTSALILYAGGNEPIDLCSDPLPPGRTMGLGLLTVLHLTRRGQWGTSSHSDSKDTVTSAASRLMAPYTMASPG